MKRTIFLIHYIVIIRLTRQRDSKCKGYINVTLKASRAVTILKLFAADALAPFCSVLCYGCAAVVHMAAKESKHFLHSRRSAKSKGLRFINYLTIGVLFELRNTRIVFLFVFHGHGWMNCRMFLSGECRSVREGKRAWGAPVKRHFFARSVADNEHWEGLFCCWNAGFFSLVLFSLSCDW